MNGQSLTFLSTTGHFRRFNNQRINRSALQFLFELIEHLLLLFAVLFRALPDRRYGLFFVDQIVLHVQLVQNAVRFVACLVVQIVLAFRD